MNLDKALKYCNQLPNDCVIDPHRMMYILKALADDEVQETTVKEHLKVIYNDSEEHLKRLSEPSSDGLAEKMAVYSRECWGLGFGIGEKQRNDLTDIARTHYLERFDNFLKERHWQINPLLREHVFNQPPPQPSKVEDKEALIDYHFSEIRRLGKLK